MAGNCCQISARAESCVAGSRRQRTSGRNESSCGLRRLRVATCGRLAICGRRRGFIGVHEGRPGPHAEAGAPVGGGGRWGFSIGVERSRGRGSVLGLFGLRGGFGGGDGFPRIEPVAAASRSGALDIPGYETALAKLSWSQKRTVCAEGSSSVSCSPRLDP
jgi:hypothetical protein